MVRYGAVAARQSSSAGIVSVRERRAGTLAAMPLSPIRDRLMRGYSCTRTLDRQADGLREQMAALASDPAAAVEVLATIRAIRGTLDRAERVALQLLNEGRVVGPTEGGGGRPLHRGEPRPGRWAPVGKLKPVRCWW